MLCKKAIPSFNCIAAEEPCWILLSAQVLSHEPYKNGRYPGGTQPTLSSPEANSSVLRHGRGMVWQYGQRNATTARNCVILLSVALPCTDQELVTSWSAAKKRQCWMYMGFEKPHPGEGRSQEDVDLITWGQTGMRRAVEGVATHTSCMYVLCSGAVSEELPGCLATCLSALPCTTFQQGCFSRHLQHACQRLTTALRSENATSMASAVFTPPLSHATWQLRAAQLRQEGGETLNASRLCGLFLAQPGASFETVLILWGFSGVPFAFHVVDTYQTYFRFCMFTRASVCRLFG